MSPDASAVNLVFLRLLQAHEDRLAELLGEDWPQFRDQLVALLQRVEAAADVIGATRAVDDIMALCLGSPAAPLTRTLMQEAAAAAGDSDTATRSIRVTDPTSGRIRAVAPSAVASDPAAFAAAFAGTWAARLRVEAALPGEASAGAVSLPRGTLSDGNGGAPDTRPQGPEPSVVTRTPHMDILGEGPLRKGQAFKVKVFADQLAARPGEESEAIEVSVPRTVTSVHLEVWIAGTSHFTFPGPRVFPFVIDLRRPEAVPSAEFDVQVREDVTDGSGAHLVANFTYNGRPSGHVSVAVPIDAPQIPAAAAVAAPPSAAPVRPDSVRVDIAAATPDLTIEITDPDNTKQHLHCRVWTPHLPREEVGEVFHWNLDRQTGALVQAYMSEFVKPRLNNEERLLSLKGAGRRLWDATPKRLRDIFWRLVDLRKLVTILIVSEEPYIPWELMIPARAGVPRAPLGAEFAVGRWLPSDFVAPGQELVLSRSLVVAPNYPGHQPKPLKHAAAEATLVLQTVPGEAVTPATLTEIRRKLETGAATLFHFVCHGAESTSIGIQIIHLEEGQWTSLQVLGMDDLAKAFRSRPLVFLNACEIGRLSSALVGVGGFAKAFIDLGASAVIAPLWSVKDEIAHKVAEEFYEGLAGGARVRPAEIFRKVRSRAYDPADPEAAGEDTYAAYCFYGDPSAVAVVPPKGTQ